MSSLYLLFLDAGLKYLTSTIKNPQSVIKYKKYLVAIVQASAVIQANLPNDPEIIEALKVK
jgi:hypothetical protein